MMLWKNNIVIEANESGNMKWIYSELIFKKLSEFQNILIFFSVLNFNFRQLFQALDDRSFDKFAINWELKYSQNLIECQNFDWNNLHLKSSFDLKNWDIFLINRLDLKQNWTLNYRISKSWEVISKSDFK